MALAHFHVTPYHVGGERLATGRIHYITRQAEYAPGAKARVEHQGISAAGLEREDLVEWDHAHLPRWCGGDPVRYFTAAEVLERKGEAPCYEEWRFSLPRELPLQQQQAAAHALLQAAFGDGHPHVFAIHNPRTVDHTMDQAHCHVIFSRRVNDGIERSEAQWFRNYKSRSPEAGGAQRSKRFGHLHSTKADRVLYCDIMNIYLEAAGEGARLHPDRLSDRGFEREREPRAKPSDSNKAKYHGEITERWQEVLDHRARYEPEKAVERINAQRAWQERKATLGIKHDQPLAEQLRAVCHARAQRWKYGLQRDPVVQGAITIEQEDRVLGDLAGEAWVQIQQEAQHAWADVVESRAQRSDHAPLGDPVNALHEEQFAIEARILAEHQATGRMLQGTQPQPRQTSARSPRMSDDEVLGLALRNEQTLVLWEGGYDKDLAAKEGVETAVHRGDVALVSRLAFYTQDPRQLDRLYRESGRDQGRWQEFARVGKTRGEEMVNQVLAKNGRTYQPPQQTHSPWQSIRQDVDALMRQLGREEEEYGGHGGVRVRLWDREDERERQREQGMGF